MIRAGVFIGVNKTGNLEKLRDAAAGARRMCEWAQSQGFDTTKLITDETGEVVHAQAIYDAIDAILRNPAGVGQLVLYFAGHGIYSGGAARWLLTQAPRNRAAAVNVSSSLEQARYCGIDHVVMVSDACRVPPEGIAAQSVEGVEIFPGDIVTEKAKPLDQFYACLLGRTAAETRDPADVARGYQSLYTNVLTEALVGGVADVLDPEPNGNRYVVMPRRLEAYLEARVPAKVREMNLTGKVNQSPDAIITSDGLWVAHVDSMGRVTRDLSTDNLELESFEAVATPLTLKAETAQVVSMAAESEPQMLNERLREMEQSGVGGAPEFAKTAKQVASTFGPDHFETQCGIKLRGDVALGAWIKDGGVELLDGGALIRLHGVQLTQSIVVHLRECGVTVIPVIPGYLAEYTCGGDAEVLNVSFEPSANSSQWHDFRGRAEEIRALRGVAAAASGQGRFRLDQLNDPLSLARKMQFVKGIDPTLAIYAAYAYYDLQRLDRIEEMLVYLADTLQGRSFFDLALLARKLRSKTVLKDLQTVPFVPMFQQGWPLLAPNRVKLHPRLDGLERMLKESVWTLFEHAALDRLVNTLASGEVL
jgi:hypothetical protein